MAIILAGLAILSGCEIGNVDKVPPDYREKYYGEFSFMVIDYYSSIMMHYYKQDTFLSQGSIRIKESTDSTIFIRYKEGNNTVICGSDSVYGAYIEPTVETGGVMDYNRVRACSNQSGFSGHFIGIDSVYVSIYSGGLGYTTGHKLMGSRIK